MNYLKIFSVVYYIGMGMYFLGVLTQLSGSNIGAYLMLFGALPIFGVRLYNRWVAAEGRERINTILLISSIFLLASAITIFFDRNYWILFVLIAAVIDGYSSFRRLT